MAHGTIDADGTITITYNPSKGDRLYIERGTRQLLPCKCGAVVDVSPFTDAVTCEDCVHAELAREIENAHHETLRTLAKVFNPYPEERAWGI